MNTTSAAAQIELLAALTGQSVRLEPFGPKTAKLSLGTLHDYPTAELRTFVTFGVAQHPFSMYRRLPLGFELVLSTPGDGRDAVDMLKAAVLENRSREAAGRRRLFEYNGLFAPGYAPHLLFTTDASATPEVIVRKKLGDRYVEFMSAIPIDDRELRQYDRSVPALIATLTRDRVAAYPRPPL